LVNGQSFLSLGDDIGGFRSGIFDFGVVDHNGVYCRSYGEEKENHTGQCREIVLWQS
jgi:hypothetical protein